MTPCSKYERGERDVPLNIMIKLAEFYKTSIDYLVGLTENKRPYRSCHTGGFWRRESDF